MENLERAETRLDNIRGVEPILSALRTISLGSWQTALKRREAVRRYEEGLASALLALLPHLRVRKPATTGQTPPTARVVALVIGSERGLCGRFNTAISERAERYLVDAAARDSQAELFILGARVERILTRRGHTIAWAGSLSATSLPPFSLASDLIRGWQPRYEKHELDVVDLVYNAYGGSGRYTPVVERLFPPSLTVPEQRTPPWPTSIIETDPLSLSAGVIEEWLAARLYDVLLSSAAAEQAARHELMEAATRNATRLIEDLTLIVQTARQQAITREMQELATGAGLVGTG